MLINDISLLKKTLSPEAYESIISTVTQFNHIQSNPDLKNQNSRINSLVKKMDPIFSLCSLRSDERINLYLSQEKKLTKDQNDYLNSILRYYENLASIWFALEFKQALPWDKNKDWVGNKIYNEGLEAHIKEIQYFWKLMQYAEPFLIEEIEKTLPRFSDIPNITTLFSKIYCTHAFNSFKVCLQPYVEVSNDKIIETLKLSCKVLEDRSLQKLKIHQRKKIKIYEDLNNTQNPYLTLTYLTCHKAAKAGDVKMQELLDKWLNLYNDNLLYALKLRNRTRSSTYFNLYYCYCWKKGEREKYGIFKDNNDNKSLVI